MEKFTFGIDVSSKTSTVAIALGERILDNYTIKNNLTGFTKLYEDISSVRYCDVIFEATGVYSRRLEAFLVSKKVGFTKLNPYASKNQLNNELRKFKTDKTDAEGLAISQARLQRKPTPQEDEVYLELRDWSRYYAQVNRDLIAHKNRLHRILQLTFPEIESFLSATDGVFYWNVVKHFPTPIDVLKSDINDIPRTLLESTNKNMSINRAQMLTDKLINFSKESYSCDRFGVQKYQVIKLAENLIDLNNEKNNIINKMAELAKDLPELQILQSIPGIGLRTALLIIAEIGDFKRFSSSNQINAFVGIDLPRVESGDKRNLDSISKQGTSIGRKVLYQAVKCMVSASKFNPNHIADYYQTKKVACSSTKKATIASMHRLIRTMHHLVINNQNYDYSQTHKQTE